MNLTDVPRVFSRIDYQQIIIDWNQTLKDFPRDKSLIHLFEEQVLRTPNHIAVVDGDRTLTYQALNHASNQLARQIQQHYQTVGVSIEPDTLITLCLDRSLELFIGMLAILKTGAAYVPIDPNNPAERIRFILNDTGSALLLTQQKKVATLLRAIPDNTQLFALDTLDYLFESDENLETHISPTNLAYVIYTSGTTGKPKGVMITHRNVINYYVNVLPYLDAVTHIDFSTSIAFDLSVTTTLIPLLCGKKIIIYSDDLREVENYIRHLQNNDIHFIKSTPSFLTQVFSFPQTTQIKVCFVGGEKLHPQQLQCLLNHCDALYDEYGPTENTVGTTLIRKTQTSHAISSIGKPYFNHHVYVLDADQKPVHIGVIGELYVGGEGVARGYLNQPELTQKRFITNPFSEKKNARLYQTGDLVRWLPDGNLEYIGRNDSQVKINGHRIELNEIEEALSSYPDILQCIVLAHENTLIAYYLSKNIINENTLITALKSWLPDYMIPHRFIHKVFFPLTTNGKIDRDALLQLRISLPRQNYLAPKTRIEKKLCTAFEAALGAEQIGISDDFFQFGGDSIKCMQVMAHLLREGIHCRVSDIFTHRCVQQLSSALEKNRVIDTEAGELTGDMPLLPVQSWFFEQSYPNINHWNQSFLVRVPLLSLTRLNAILPTLIAHHDALRLCFPNQKPTYGKPKYPTSIKHLEQFKSETLTQSQEHFDIENGPLWEIGYITGYADNSARLYFAFHHLIIDTVSWRIIIDDLKRLYEGLPLGEKGSSYRQWCHAIHRYTQLHPDEIAFWKKRTNQSPTPTLVNTAFHATFSLSRDITQHLIGPANKAYDTEINDLLLTALSITLSDYFENTSNSITLEGHGREEIDDTLEISRTVGWFTSLYPVTLTTQENISSTLTHLKSYLREIPHKGIGFGAFKYADNLVHALPDLPKITFNYLGQFDNTSGYWQVVREFSGDTVHANNKRPHILDITGSVIENVLHMSLSSHLSQTACTEIALLFEKQLHAIVDHCMTIESRFPANSLQQGFLYHAITHPESDAYRVQHLLDYYNALDINKYKNAWHNAIFKNPILRTYFSWEKSLTQIISDKGNLYFQYHDFSEIADKEKALSDLQSNDRLIAFDLSKPTLMRLHCIKFSPSHFVVLQNTHHSILDGWSASILFNQVHALYLAELNGQPLDLTIDNTYLEAQRYIQNHCRIANTYWQAQLQQISQQNDINALLSYPANLDTIRKLEKPSHLTLKLSLPKTEFTSHTLIQFAWHKLIRDYTADNQTTVGVTVSGRSIPVIGIHNSIGLYINTLPLSLTWNDTDSIQEHLKIIESQLIALNDYSFVELASLQKNGQRLFHTLVIAEYDDALQSFDTLPIHSRGSIEVLDYPLALIVREKTESITLKLKYDETLLTQEKARQLLCYLERILLQIPDKFSKPHHAICLLSNSDYQQQIYDWNQTATPYPSDKTIHELFEAQVLKTPNATALISSKKSISYHALNSAANQLAHLIRSQFCITPSTLIAFCIDHSFEMVICQLAILKAGAAYVPIDPRYPAARIQAILQDAACDCLFTSENLFDTLELIRPKKTRVIRINENRTNPYKEDNLPLFSTPTDLAYVLYTSGTTGTPKGVMITHRNVCNYLSSITQNEAYQKGTVVDCSSSIAFDATMAVLFAPLIIGRTVVLCDPDLKRDTHLYLSHLKNNAIDLIRMTPSYLSALIATHHQSQFIYFLSHVRCLILGGEKANAADINTWMTLFPNCSVINHYGPTETTVACAIYTIPQAKKIKHIPLGKAAHNHQFYVLDRFHHPVPLGVTGELYVSGDGVAKGYLNQPSLTEKHFIANPFIKNTRLYQTGDFVRWREDGFLEFVGRRDFQVNIRGYRVELSDIENILLRYAGIQQCTIIYDNQLIAYYVSTSNVSPSALEKHAKNNLPDYMVPTAFIKLDAMPLTHNGKLDRNALPKPARLDQTSEYAAPRDALEKTLYEAWQSILNNATIGIHDDFFRLGGHSILAIHLSHKISQVMNRDVSVTDIFKYKTIANLSDFLKFNNTLTIIPKSEQTQKPLSYAQERLWFIEQMESGTDVYHIPLVFMLDSEINTDRLQYALQCIVKRHETLRTFFTQDTDGNFIQAVQEGDLVIESKHIYQADFLDERQAFSQKIFDLTHEYAIRACFFETIDTNIRFLIIVFHHVAFDAWSKNIFMSELQHFYNNAPERLAPLDISYGDFAVWQRKLVTEKLDTLLSYWKNNLNDYEHLNFPTDYKRPLKMDYRGNAVHFQLSQVQSLKLKQLAESQNTTLYTVLLTSFAILLAKYTGQTDLMIGTPITNRQHTQLSKLIGFFVNVLPLRIRFHPNNTFLQCLQCVHTHVMEMQSHQDIPFATLIEHLDSVRESSQHPLFQIVFNMEYADKEIDLPLKSVNDDNDYQRSKLDLGVTMQERPEGIHATLQYATALFRQETIEQVARHYERILTDLVDTAQLPINAYSLLTSLEYQKIVYDWNNTDQDYPHEKTVHQLFEAQVSKTPEKVALVYNNEQMTYCELNEKANQLAFIIQQHNLPGNAMIAFCLNRSMDMVVSLLAILKAGCAYVPIEPHTPIDRMRYILNDTQCLLVLTHKACLSKVKEAASLQTQCLVIDQLDNKNKKTANLENKTKPNDLAYVIYTSGTTGVPKGVMVMHQGVTNIVHHIPKSLYLNDNSRVIQFASIAFDAASLQILNPITIGATLFIAPESIRKDVKALADFLKTHRITYAGLPPVLLSHLNPSEFPDLSTLVVAGESANAAVMSQWRPGRRVINAYGPTENSIGATLHCYELNDSHTNIGRPLPNIKAYVLDTHLMPLPIGVVGELYLGGAGVARGYLNQAEQTDLAFIESPFIAHTKLYKTGDLARWSHEGDLEFMGRNDFQVKIRGYRIELHEIEKIILKYENIKQCVVLTSEQKTGDQSDLRLVAYYVSTRPISVSALKAEIEMRLPSYMVPSAFIALDAFPQTTNGKLDKKALPKPQFIQNSTEYAAPRNALESLLCTLWQDTLRIENVGIDDDFFRLGGHSILAVHLSHKMTQATQRQITIADIFKHKTIAKLCAELQSADHTIAIEPIADTRAPLSFAQERLWFIEQYENGTHAYHIPMLLALTADADVAALEKALQAVIQRHEILRTVFVRDNNDGYLQEVKNDPLVIAHQKTDQTHILIDQQTLMQQSFDLTKDYPIRACLFDFTETDTRLLMIVFHHIACDAWSKNIFLSELQFFYNAITHHKIENPAPLKIQYNDFSVWQRNVIKNRMDSLMAYWTKTLKDHTPLEFPIDYPRPLMMDYRGDVVHFRLPVDLLNKLNSVASENNVTLFTVLLGGFALLLSKYTGQTDIVLGTPVINREHPDLNNLIGLFINSLVLRIQLQKNSAFNYTLSNLQKNIIEAQLHQDLPFEQLINALRVARDTSRHPLFQTLFTVFDNTTDILNEAPWKLVESQGLSQTAKFDLSVSIQTDAEGAQVSLQYATALFKKETIERFAAHYHNILIQLCENADLPLDSYTVLSKAELQTLVYDWNTTDKPYPNQKTIHGYFDDQARKTPDHIALVFQNRKLTYRELNEESNQLAHYIGKQAPNTLIGLCVERSIESVIGLLGILKTGAAYVPIDANYPVSRIAYLVEDTDCQCIVTEKKLAPLFKNTAAQLLFLDEKPHCDASKKSLPTVTQSNDLAYVMYTSGTTGFPKGVMVEHRSVMCLLQCALCSENDSNIKSTLWTNITFDVSVYEIFSSLFFGSELHILSDDVRLEDHKLFHYILKNQISACYMPPFFVEKMAHYLDTLSVPFPLKKLLLSVEPIQVQHVKGFIEKGIAVANAYGPTETTVFSTAYFIEDIKSIPGKRVPIGKPLNNEKAYILDENRSPVPVGVIGELYIGGEGLARGYWKKSDLTAKSFVENPFAPSTKLYKTGDLVRFLSDGNIEYIGRRDFQVKIHGLRIELGEIEHALLSHAKIHNCVVLMKEKKLIAYYTGETIESTQLRSYLSTLLPDAMVPSAFIYVTDLPLNANGKLDRDSLLKLEVVTDQTEGYISPRNAMETTIAAIWQDILNNPRIGITDDFFSLGGDSISSIQVISRLHYANINCSLKDIFHYRTIQRLADHIAAQSTEINIHAEQGVLEGSFDLLPIQRWFFEQSFSKPNHWNQAFLVRVPTLSFEKLLSAIPQWVNHHDMLRARFIKNHEGEWQQHYNTIAHDFSIQQIQKTTEDDLLLELNAIQSSFDIENGPLWAMAYIEGYADNSARLFFACHHLLIDIVSWRILVDDLKRVYHNELLGLKTSSYRQWQKTITTYADTHSDERVFWDSQKNSKTMVSDNPTQTSHTLQLDEALTTQLTKENHLAYHTKTDDLLLTALAYAVSQITGHHQCVVTLEGHGREAIDDHIDISQTVGWFTCLYPVNLQIHGDLSSSISSVKDQLRSIPNKGIGYGALYANATPEEKKLPPIYFNYKGQFHSSQDTWSFVSEKVGTSIHPDNTYDFCILLNAVIIEGKLNISFALKLNEKESELFITTFHQTLIAIAAHCSGQIHEKQFRYTLGDFKAVEKESDLYALPLSHDPIAYYEAFEMTSIQKAYAVGRLKQFEIGNVANHIYTEFYFDEINISKLEKVLNKLIQTYPEMRTVFNVQDLTQRYLPYENALYYAIETQTFDEPYNENALADIRDKLTHIVYDVTTYPLFHFSVSRFLDCMIVHASFDLLLLDAQTRTKFFTELTHLYTEEDYALPKRSVSFRDYQCYMQLLKTSPWYASDKAYWKKKLLTLPLRPKLSMACDPRSIQKPLFKLNRKTISSKTWQAFKKNCEKYGVSYASVLLSLYGYVLSRFSESGDFLITMTLFNRYGIHPDVNHLWGDFTSTNLFGFSRKAGSAIDFFKYTHEQLWDDIAHALYTGLDVQRDLMNLHQLEPTMAISPIVFTCIVGDTQQRAETQAYFISANEHKEKRYWIGQTSQAWIDLQATERDGAFSSGWLYVSQLFSDDFMEALNQAYTGLIDYLANNTWENALPSVSLNNPHLSLIHSINATQTVMPSHTLVSLFHSQAHERPTATAVIDHKGSYDYQTLKNKSDSLAFALHKKGIGKKQLIAVLAEKGINQVIATLGIMNTGAAYLPLNVEWPLGRIKDILVEGKVSHLLVSETQWENIKDSVLIHEYTIHRIEMLSDAKHEEAFKTDINPHDPAYVIYTSGSTGKPKGVCISHFGAVNTVLSVNQAFQIDHTDVVLALSELSFDLSVYDLFGILAAGGTIVFPDQSLSKEPTHWAALINKHRVTLWDSVPQLMQLLLDNAKNDIAHLRVVLLSGDWVPLSLVSQVKALPSKPIVMSLGGATEASIWSIWYDTAHVNALPAVPYGFPMPNQTIYVLNTFGELCDAGIPGEIHIGGVGLALGYWQDKEKTEQRFIQHAELGRLYKTGDLGKWHQSGYVEFLGRIDNQVKRNGNRIELDEIAVKLTQINGIENAIVRMQADQLIAYVVSSDFKSQQTAAFDREQFKLSQKGLRNDLTETIHFKSSQLSETIYRLHKSYRQFSDEKISDAVSLSSLYQHKNKGTEKITTQDDLGALFSVLQARKLADKILPKYLYPSAGSTYAVQCYVNIPISTDEWQAGFYYYHPMSHTLQCVYDCPTHADFSLTFEIDRAAIEPLYTHDWQRLAHLECGHMIYLITDFLNQKNIGYALKQSENSDQCATLILNTEKPTTPFSETLKRDILRKNAADIFNGTHRSFDLSAQTPMMQSSEVGHIVTQSQALFVFEGEDNPSTWIHAGFEAQHHIIHWQTLNLAYCPLGLRLDNQVIYAFALGKRSADATESAETHATGPTLSDILLKALSQQLPCYMLPHVFIPLNTLPLSPNGKIDFGALPQPDFTEHLQTYTPPTTEIEKILCTVWEEVLELDQVSITDDFFRIGGDSILSIHVTTKLRHLGIQCDVLSIFEYRSIERLAPHVTVNETDDNELAMDIHTDISDELLAQLQSRYETGTAV